MKIQITFFCLGLALAQSLAASPQPSGGLWATGYNQYGALGDSTTDHGTNEVDLPEAVVPNNVVSVAAGTYHTLFIKSDGSLWATGSDSYGELGNGTNTSSQLSPVEIQFSNVVSAAGGNEFSLFVKKDGSLWGMGEHIDGQLGDGVSPASTNFGVVLPELIFPSNVVAVSAGIKHSVFVKNDGSLWAMGGNGYGQLGDGTYGGIDQGTNQPEMVVPSGVASVAAGGLFTLYVTTNGDLFAMGDDQYGALGDGKGAVGVTTNQPEMITNGVSAAAAGSYHSLFISTNGSLWGMGLNEYGQLGDGTTNNRLTPVMIEPSNVVAVACGYDHSLFIQSDGSLWGMGHGVYGALGIGSHSNELSPVMIEPSNTMAVAAGMYFTVFVAPVVASTPMFSIAATANPPAGGSVGGAGSFDAGTTNALTATANAGYTFVNWSGDASGTSNPLSVVVNTNLNIVANFVSNIVSTNITITVVINGDGKVTPIPGDKTFKAGSHYTLTATPAAGNLFSGWTGSVTTNKNPLVLTRIESSLVITANFVTNPFIPFEGTYNGLFMPTNGASETTSGMVRGLTVNKKGTYSGSLLIGALSHPLAGVFDASGAATNVIKRPVLAGGTLTVTLALMTNGLVSEVTGTVTGTNWTAKLNAGLADTAFPAAQFTMLIPPDTNNAPPTNSPGGDGFALMTTHLGTVKVSGALADGTVLSEATTVAANGFVPIYDSLYSGKGLLIGWVTLDLTNISGTGLTWIRPQARTGLYAAGFTNSIPGDQLLLSQWMTPDNFDGLTNISILDYIGAAPSNTAVTVSAAGRITGPGVIGVIAPKTGLFTVRFTDNHKAFSRGAMLNATNGGGYVIDGSTASGIELGP